MYDDSGSSVNTRMIQEVFLYFLRKMFKLNRLAVPCLSNLIDY
jgi:hypothetical protein